MAVLINHNHTTENGKMETRKANRLAKVVIRCSPMIDTLVNHCIRIVQAYDGDESRIPLQIDNEVSVLRETISAINKLQAAKRNLLHLRSILEFPNGRE
jgi:hypothetical protein